MSVGLLGPSSKVAGLLPPCAPGQKPEFYASALMRNKSPYRTQRLRDLPNLFEQLLPPGYIVRRRLDIPIGKRTPPPEPTSFTLGRDVAGRIAAFFASGGWEKGSEPLCVPPGKDNFYFSPLVGEPDELGHAPYQFFPNMPAGSNGKVDWPTHFPPRPAVANDSQLILHPYGLMEPKLPRPGAAQVPASNDPDLPVPVTKK
jgi:hypothetical protein